eukprot:Hpha_TRINITY_DN15835_c2_g1::TRINITY_DN15835_c2_g1_i2::g.188781::m.188781/K12402/AP4M1; AP-4 complex subunit mu-1
MGGGAAETIAPPALSSSRLAPVVEVFVLSGRGHTLLQYTFQKAARIPGIEEVFYRRVVREVTPPVFRLHGASVGWLRRDSFLLMVYTRANPSPSLLLEFLCRLHTLVSCFVGQHSDPSSGDVLRTTERDVCRNQPMLYELLQEMVDEGALQTTDAAYLQTHLQSRCEWDKPREGWTDIRRLVAKTLDRRREEPEVPTGEYGRPLLVGEGEGEKRNCAIFIDVVESVDAQFSTDGAVRDGSVRALGEVRCKTTGEGAPLVTLALGDVDEGRGVQLKRWSASAAVRREDWEKSRRLVFKAMPGEHSMLRCEVKEGVMLPFMLCSSVAYPDPGTLSITVKVKAVFGVGTRVVRAVCIVPCPPDDPEPHIAFGFEKKKECPGQTVRVLNSPADAERSRVSVGASSHRVVEWRLGNMSTDSPEHLLHVTCSLGAAPRGVFKGTAELRFELLDWPATALALGDVTRRDGGMEGCDIANTTTSITPRRWVRRSCRQGSYVVDILGVPPQEVVKADTFACW